MKRFFPVLFAAAVGLLGCGSSGSDGGDDTSTGDVFLAFAEDFRGFHSWTSVDATDGAELVGIHDGSIVTEYINPVPPSGSTEFPVGTIVVKEATGGTIPHELFGMVKRGGGFNSGAPGWEWFEIELLDDGNDGVKLVWRGFGPPLGETYGGDADAGCNTCHTECGNDAVCATALNLANF